MTKMLQPILVICLLIGYSNFLSSQCDSINGEWVNELGSVLVIDQVDGSGKIHGVYKSSTGVDGKNFALLGWVNNLNKDSERVSLAFSVRWEGYGSITSWTGFCEQDDSGDYIKTLWHLVRPAEEFQWESIITSSSTFRPLKK